MSADCWALFPWLGFLGLVALELSRRPSGPEAVLRSAIWWAAGVWVLANLLGIFGALQPVVLRGCWVLLGGGVFIAGAARLRRSPRNLVAGWPALSGGEWVFAAAGAGLLGLTLVTTVFSPPVTVDVLNYHLPRQLMWLQQGSLDHFITINDRELMMPPLAEVIGLQFLALTGGDHWVNLPQWFAYVLLGLVVMKIARGLGLSRPMAWLAAWLVWGLPMAYHEASNGKNDLQEAFWIALLLWQVVEARRGNPSAGRPGLVVGTILALALLTKSTAFIYAPPLVAAGWLAWRCTGGARQAWRQTAVAGLVCLVLVAPFFARNFAWYGTPLGVHRAEDGGQQANTAFTPALVASNVIRDAASDLALPSPGWNKAVYQLAAKLHHWLGLSVNDQRNTLWLLGFTVDYFPSDETRTAAPFDLMAIVLAVLLAFLVRRARAWRWLALMVFSLGGIYCLILKWQPWGARLQLPIFVLGVLLVAGVLSAVAGRRSATVLWSAGLLGFLAWWPAREDDKRPLWTSPTIFEASRDVNEYRGLPLLRRRDIKLAERLRAAQVHSIAIVSIHDLSYPLMQRLRQAIPGVHFYGAPASDAAGLADAYVKLVLLQPLPLYFTVPGAGPYRLVGDGLGDGIYLPEAKVRALGWLHQLPDFSGWVRSEGMRISADTTLPGGQLGDVRYLPSGRSWMEFQAETDQVYLRATVVKTDQVPETLEFGMNGIVVHRSELQPPVGLQHLEVALPCHPGINRLEIRRADGSNGELQFTRLQLNDVAP
ncbi:MAG: ArnT family glycosyltransferase [Opitutales bacterium]